MTNLSPYNQKLSQVIGFYIVLILLMSVAGGYFSEQIPIFQEGVSQVADTAMTGFFVGAVVSVILYYFFGRNMITSS